MKRVGFEACETIGDGAANVTSQHVQCERGRWRVQGACQVALETAIQANAAVNVC